jgi:hypothetical protein
VVAIKVINDVQRIRVTINGVTIVDINKPEMNESALKNEKNGE